MLLYKSSAQVHVDVGYSHIAAEPCQLTPSSNNSCEFCGHTHPLLAKSTANAAPKPDAPPVIMTEEPSSLEVSSVLVKSTGVLILGAKLTEDIFTSFLTKL